MSQRREPPGRHVFLKHQLNATTSAMHARSPWVAPTQLTSEGLSQTLNELSDAEVHARIAGRGCCFLDHDRCLGDFVFDNDPNSGVRGQGLLDGREITRGVVEGLMSIYGADGKVDIGEFFEIVRAMTMGARGDELAWTHRRAHLTKAMRERAGRFDVRASDVGRRHPLWDAWAEEREVMVLERVTDAHVAGRVCLSCPCKFLGSPNPLLALLAPFTGAPLPFLAKLVWYPRALAATHVSLRSGALLVTTTPYGGWVPDFGVHPLACYGFVRVLRGENPGDCAGPGSKVVMGTFLERDVRGDHREGPSSLVLR